MKQGSIQQLNFNETNQVGGGHGFLGGDHLHILGMHLDDFISCALALGLLVYLYWRRTV